MTNVTNTELIAAENHTNGMHKDNPNRVHCQMCREEHAATLTYAADRPITDTDRENLVKATSLLLENGFERDMGAMVDVGYVGESAFDTNFGTDYVMWPVETTQAEREAMTPDERHASYERFSSQVLRVTLNYMTAVHIIRLLDPDSFEAEL